MATIKDLKRLGYTVEEAQDHGENEQTPFGVVWRVEGFGVSTMVPDDDEESIDSLAASAPEARWQHENPEAVADRTDVEAAGHLVELGRGGALTVDGKRHTVDQLAALARDVRVARAEAQA